MTRLKIFTPVLVDGFALVVLVVSIAALCWVANNLSLACR